jgi:hypothetical protein
MPAPLPDTTPTPRRPDPQLHLEILGTEHVVVQALPNSRGAFSRGCVDRFTLLSEAGDIGDITAVKVWHEGPGLIDMAYCLDRVEIESKFKGIKYRWGLSWGSGQRRALPPSWGGWLWAG